MKSDDLFVVGHRVFLLLLDYIFRCNSIIQGVSDRRRECMISAVKLSDLCGQSVRRRAAYSTLQANLVSGGRGGIICVPSFIGIDCRFGC